MQRDFARDVELGPAHDQHRVDQIDVSPVKPESFAQAEAGHCQQSYQRFIGRGAPCGS